VNLVSTFPSLSSLVIGLAPPFTDSETGSCRRRNQQYILVPGRQSLVRYASAVGQLEKVTLGCWRPFLFRRRVNGPGSLNFVQTPSRSENEGSSRLDRVEDAVTAEDAEVSQRAQSINFKSIIRNHEIALERSSATLAVKFSELPRFHKCIEKTAILKLGSVQFENGDFREAREFGGLIAKNGKDPFRRTPDLATQLTKPAGRIVHVRRTEGNADRRVSKGPITASNIFVISVRFVVIVCFLDPCPSTFDNGSRIAFPLQAAFCRGRRSPRIEMPRRIAERANKSRPNP
jgi:hypothetical protein